jgi:hypothetical protein
MRRFLVALMALGLLAHPLVGALAQGYTLALGVQERVQVTTNSSWFQNFLALSDEELSDVSGSAGQLFADVETYTFAGLWGAIGTCLCTLASQALGLSGAADLAFQILGNVAWGSLGIWIWKQGEIGP